MTPEEQLDSMLEAEVGAELEKVVLVENAQQQENKEEEEEQDVDDDDEKILVYLFHINVDCSTCLVRKMKFRDPEPLCSECFTEKVHEERRLEYEAGRLVVECKACRALAEIWHLCPDCFQIMLNEEPEDEEQ